MNKVVNGSEAFWNLYEELSAENGMDLIIKDHVHGSGEYIFAGRHFDSSILSLVHFTKPDNGNISGTGLLEAGKKVLKNCKKALSLMRKLNGKIVKLNDRQEVTDYFSGEKEVDLMRHINDGMYMMLNNEKNNESGMNDPVLNIANREEVVANGEEVASVEGIAKGAQTNGHAGGGRDSNGEVETTNVNRSDDLFGDNDNVSIDGLDDIEGLDVSSVPNKDWIPFGGTAPPPYRFPGYIAFACFGPHTPYLSVLLSTKGNSVEKKKNHAGGREAIREEQTKRQRVERNHGTHLGMNMQAKVHVASIAQNEDGADMRDKEGRFAALATLIQSKSSMSERKLRQSELTSVESKKESLLQASIDLDDEILVLETQIHNRMKEKRKRNGLVAHVMEQAAKVMDANAPMDQNVQTNANANRSNVA